MQILLNMIGCLLQSNISKISKSIARQKYEVLTIEIIAVLIALTLIIVIVMVFKMAFPRPKIFDDKEEFLTEEHFKKSKDHE